MQDALSFFKAIFDTFDKGAVELFRGWMSERPGTTKWFIGADFALRDRSRFGDCFAFSIIPYEKTFEDYRNAATAGLPRDLKDSRTLTPEGQLGCAIQARFT